MINVRSIQFRLILWYSSLVTAGALAFGAVIYQDVESRLHRNLQTTLSRRAREVSTDILPRFGLEDRSAFAQAINELYSPAATDRFIRVSTAGGEIVFLSGRPDDGMFDPQQIPLLRDTTGRRSEKLTASIDLDIVAVKRRLGDQDVLIEMGGTTAEIQTVLMDLRRSLLIGLPFMVLVIAAGGYVLVRRSLRPVEDLRAKAQEITFGNLGNRLPVAATGDAIEHLSVTLNQMLDRLAEAYQQASRFSADASHELRTPLSIMRAELESLVHQSGMISGPVKTRLSSVLEETERMSFITESLFALSRLDAGEAKIKEVHLDLSAMVRNTVDQIRLLTDDKRIALSVKADQPVHVLGDPARLKQMIVDLLDNAIKYTPAGGAITLTVGIVGDKAAVQIADTGIGISPEDLPHVFERFYRADKARSRQIDGAGLGLAIVRSICHAHGGSVDIESVEGSGTTCHVHIPLAA